MVSTFLNSVAIRTFFFRQCDWYMRRNIRRYGLADWTHLIIWVGSNDLDSEQSVAEYLKYVILVDAAPGLFTPVERVTKWPVLSDYIHALAVSGLVKGASSLMYDQRLKMTSKRCSGVEERGPYPLRIRRLNCIVFLIQIDKPTNKRLP